MLGAIDLTQWVMVSDKDHQQERAKRKAAQAQEKRKRKKQQRQQKLAQEKEEEECQLHLLQLEEEVRVAREKQQEEEQRRAEEKEQEEERRENLQQKETKLRLKKRSRSLSPPRRYTRSESSQPKYRWSILEHTQLPWLVSRLACPQCRRSCILQCGDWKESNSGFKVTISCLSPHCDFELRYSSTTVPTDHPHRQDASTRLAVAWGLVGLGYERLESVWGLAGGVLPISRSSYAALMKKLVLRMFTIASLLLITASGRTSTDCSHRPVMLVPAAAIAGQTREAYCP